MKLNDITTTLLDELEYGLYLDMHRPIMFLSYLTGESPPPPTTPMSFEEWIIQRRQLHPTRTDLDKLLPDQIRLYPGNYEWWSLPDD